MFTAYLYTLRYAFGKNNLPETESQVTMPRNLSLTNFWPKSLKNALTWKNTAHNSTPNFTPSAQSSSSPTPQPLTIGELANRPSSNLISVIIPTRNRYAKVRQAVESVLSGQTLPLELIVVDQSDEEIAGLTEEVVREAARRFNFPFSLESDTRLAEYPAQVRYIRTATKGAGLCRNLGALAARGEVLFFTDDDCIVSSDLIKNVEQEYQQNPEIAGMYGRVMPAQTREKKRDGTELSRSGLDRRVYDHPACPWQIGSGNNMSFRKAIFLACGKFDEVLTIGGPFEAFEDLDIAYRILLRGFQLSYNGQVLVYHDSPKTFAEQLRTERGYGKGAGGAMIKYMRCGDFFALWMLYKWIWHMAVRRSLAGILKWRNWRVVRLALIQFYAPWLGVWQGLRWQLDRQNIVFVTSAKSPETTLSAQVQDKAEVA